MTSKALHLPRPVVVYFFVQPNQQLVRWTYRNLRAAKAAWSTQRLLAAATRRLAPWTGESSWVWASDGYTLQYSAAPTQGLILRYAGGAPVPSTDIVASTPRKRRRYKHTIDQPSQRAVAKRLRYQQCMDELEPSVRSRLKVHRTYYEDAFSVRRSERGWKFHRTTQWKA